VVTGDVLESVMTYPAKSSELMMSSWVVKATNQSIGTSLTAITYDTNIVEEIDPYGGGITVNSASITLPAGGYYLQASLNAYYGASSSHQFNYAFYDGASQIGYQGSLNTWVVTTPTPLRDQTARAFISVTSPTNIEVKGSCTSANIVMNTPAYSYNTMHLGRVLIWRIA
jgi:hypothetical protein